MKARVLDAGYGVAVLVAALTVYFAGGGDDTVHHVANDPFWYPKVLLILIGVCSLWLLVKSALGRSGTPPSSLQWRALAATVVISGAYLLAYEALGFVPSTLVLMLVMSGVLGFRHPLWLVVISVLFTAVIWYGFADLLNRTPPGPALPSVPSLFQ
ncbi:hypothetical protein A6D6_01999 [Alcanivorax xiamenensis]|uniref:DUF1468 domain-containing protein n=1 Tax=Alcanivorax xiamenensis TaxID=1177156 RepID=A0ABQ6Y8L1_9GAMM|nr:tripartite tricarboxylate transporter TctB family protein [Alcanivorax xiamenensis]KAF0805943.1 hypothetical protein A6D6_01999 [Alcanivorax xiamenensis]